MAHQPAELLPIVGPHCWPFSSRSHAVIGRFHIVPPLDDNYIHQVMAALKEIGPDYLVLAHCCGERFYDFARAEMPDKGHSLGGRGQVCFRNLAKDGEDA